MVPTPTFKNLPLFGASASLVEPVLATYQGGFLPGQVFPAEYENWLMNYITFNSLANQTTVQSLVAEVISVLTAASISPTPASTSQLYQALNALYATVGALSGICWRCSCAKQQSDLCAIQLDHDWDLHRVWFFYPDRAAVFCIL
ncbi:hypothetical protein [Tetrasphaera phage TJE1]|uniref:Uncharacterized protein n=1 Tax=Tetrasphaera phage TJE1 TaxID=981335 RepID=G4W975_9CAUD|nr:hypothetical protein G185_gp43 [Tetrasphaera phage TJE1]ADX42563.1 hypothetical protein [Tetrasphaera phage TJE1]